MNEREPKKCAECKDKSCESIYNEDGECWNHDPTAQIHYLTIARKIGETIRKSIDDDAMKGEV